MASAQTASTPPPAHKVVVLGGNFAGLQVTHYLLRQIFPYLERLDPHQKYHIDLVSPNSHYFFKIAAPRALTKTNAIPSDCRPYDMVFKPILHAYNNYSETCAFIQGKAVALDPQARTVTVRTVPQGTHRVLRYDSLFICTGTTTASPLWTLHDDHDITIEAFREMDRRLPNTHTLLIAGGGPVGVETAGEIAAAYPGIQITLVTNGDVLPRLPEALRENAKKRLWRSGVRLMRNISVLDTSTTASGTVVTLSNGPPKTVDMFIDCRGATRINSEYLPQAWLEPGRRVHTRDNYLRVQGDNSAPADGVYAVGDIVAGSPNTAYELDDMVITAGSSFGYDMSRRLRCEPKPGLRGSIGRFFRTSRGMAQKEFKPRNDTIMVTIGPKGGVGQYRGVSMPSLAVRTFKGRQFMIHLVDPIVSGSKYSDERQRQSLRTEN